MAASAKTHTLENPDITEKWTVVLPRRGKQRSRPPKLKTLEQEIKPWIPTDLETDINRELRLMQKLQVCMKKVEDSQFCQSIFEQIQSPQISDLISTVLGPEPTMQMVIYGIGSIESYETPRLQLSLAILIKRKFNWIGEVEIFDPVLSATESRVLEALGCSVLSLNEQGRRKAVKPTLFFMPHCEAELYNNLLQENWTIELLSNIVLFGNSFKTYDQHVSEFKNSIVVHSGKIILKARRFTHEFDIDTVTEDYYRAFHDSSWHFFSPGFESLEN